MTNGERPRVSMGGHEVAVAPSREAVLDAVCPKCGLGCETSDLVWARKDFIHPLITPPTHCLFCKGETND